MLSIVRKLSSLTRASRPFALTSSLSSPTPSLSFISPSHYPLLPGASAVSFLLSFPHKFSSQPSSSPPSFSLAFIRGGCYDADDTSRPTVSLPLCPGCGVHMQDSDPSIPGFFSLPSTKSPDYHVPISPLPLSSTSDAKTSLSLKSGYFQELADQNRDPLPHDSNGEDTRPLVCARCHSLRNYGRVKVPSAENLLPDFDFYRMIAPRMTSPSGPRSLVLFVVDAADFDGSFPRKVARLLSASIDRNSHAWKENKPANIPRIILVVTKIDLLPPFTPPDMLDTWARRRADVLGSVKLSGVHLVSAAKGWGVKNLVKQVAELAGSRGNVWAVGAQNAGKSTLINAMGSCVGQKTTHLTEAPVPGTTLGIVRIEGILCKQAKLFDTPGILHPYQITMRLTREEQRLVHMSKELKPRTYRIKAGHSIHIGGLMRVDVDESSADSIYVTVWASPLLPLHMGKKENSHKLKEDHFGRQLQPPASESRVGELGQWVRREFRVSGDSWAESSTDIAAAGLGWVALCLTGEAVLGVWTYDGIYVVSRSSLIFERAKIFEESGFTSSKIVSKADGKFRRKKPDKDEKKGRVHKIKPPSTKCSREGDAADQVPPVPSEESICYN